MTDWKDNKGLGPWAFTKQQPKYGYRNNPRWVNPAGTGVETLSPVWPMTEGKMSAGDSDKHEPCGYWYAEPITGVGGGGPGSGVSCTTPGLHIGYTTQQMSINQVQYLTVLDESGDVVVSYNCEWAVEFGGGTITKDGVYTAPATNPNCDKNATIALICRGLIIDTLQIAVNQSTSSAPAYSQWLFTNCTQYSPDPSYDLAWGLSSRYNCDGTLYNTTAISSLNYKKGCGAAIAELERLAGPQGTVTDLRTTAMETAGCCPAALL